MRKNKVLVTGGAGFIGTNLIESLDEYEVYALYHREKGIPGAEWIKADVADDSLDIIREISPDYIVHLAATLDRNPENIRSTIGTNLFSALNIYKACLGLKSLKCIVSFGSGEEYGTAGVPFTEGQRESPASPYSLSKTLAVYLSEYFFRQHKLPVVTLRPFVVYGPHQKGSAFIPYTIERCLSNEKVLMTRGEQTRDFVYVGDVCRAVKLALKNHGKCLGQTINICTGEEIPIRDAAVMIKKVTGSGSELCFGAVPYRDGEIMRYAGSNRKAEELLGWKPGTGFEEGIRKTADFISSRNKT